MEVKRLTEEALAVVSLELLLLSSDLAGLDALLDKETSLFL